jgi:ubiquinone/menaquinone biosynthesis C-methylase UbiE
MKDHFRFLAPVYDRLIGMPPDKNRWNDLLRLPTGGRMLDAGGGTGRISFPLRGAVNGLFVCDFSLPMLRQAKKKGELSAVRAQVERLPFPDGSFARIIVADAFHHFSDQGSAIRELQRVLEPGGRMVIEEPDIRRFPVKLAALAEKALGMGSRFAAPEVIRDLLVTYGFETGIVSDGGYFVWIVADRNFDI